MAARKTSRKKAKPEPGPELEERSAEETSAALREMRTLARRIQALDDAYYNDGQSELDDSEYDALKRELIALEEKHPDLAEDDSPTKRVGAPVRERRGFAKAKHRVPMLSLESLTSEEEVRDFVERARKSLELSEEDPALTWSLEPKYDGVSASLTYEDGVLVRGLSRGDGSTGELVTENYRRVRGVPEKLSGKNLPSVIEVRGEVLLERARFLELQTGQEERGETVFRNARNAVAGALKRIDPVGLEELGMDFIAFTIGDVAGFDLADDHPALMQQLGGFGFRTSELLRAGEGVDAILEYHRELEDERDALPYEMDGIVAKIAHFSHQRALGRTSRAPKWALAYKFAPRQEWTSLREIRVQVGRTGAITPVAILEAVDLAGVTVQRASLHNFALVQERDVREGDRVLVERAGDVIPEVVRVDLEARAEDIEPFAVPEACPECGEGVHGDGPILYCSNFDCPAQIRERIVHLASRRALDIDRLGDKYVDQLFDAGLLGSIEDVFFLTDDTESLLALERWGPKSVQALDEELDRARKPELGRFLYALGIRHVGRSISRDLADHFGSLDALRAAELEALLEVEGVGDVVAQALYEFFRSPRTEKLFARLAEAGVAPLEVEAKAVADDAPLAGRVFVFTGGLEAMTRDQARERVEALGAKVVSGVSKKVTDVVAGPGAGSKRAKAEKLELRILSEEDLLALLGAPSEGGTAT